MRRLVGWFELLAAVVSWVGSLTVVGALPPFAVPTGPVALVEVWASAAPASRKALAAPIVAPPRASPAPTPLAAARAAGPGSAPTAGAGASGNGNGAGGTGNGPGGGGSGALTPARKLTKIPDREYRRFAATGASSGTVAISIRVNPDGSVSNCRVTRSSGNPYADSLMCQLTVQYVRFSPALDPSGRPIAQDVTWMPNWAPR